MKLILFDFDGVLANTIELSYKIHTIKNKDLTLEKFQEFSSGNFYEGYDKAVKDGKHIPADDFPGEYKKGLDNLSIEEKLHKLVFSLAKKYKLAIVSSTDTSYIINFLEKEKIIGCFSDILGSDIHKNKAVKIKMILEKYNISPSDSVFITDTLGDIIEASECQVPSIGVAWGLHNKEILSRGKPLNVVNTPEELEEKIEELNK